jgi:hypothetical protein
MLPTSQERPESALDLDEAMPLKSDSTARRALMMEANEKAAKAAAAMSRRFAKERRLRVSDMSASWRWAVMAAVTGAKRYRDRGRS